MDKAREAIRAGDLAKAERMLNKAKKLDPKQDISCEFHSGVMGGIDDVH